MADKKVSELDAITGANTAADDFFLIVDSSGSVSKKISKDELSNAVGIGATVDINGGTIDGTTIGGSSAAVGTFTTANATTLDTTNIEVTNIKAKDGTSAGSIANSTGVVTLSSSVLTTTDINAGTIDGTTIGGSSAAVGTFTTLNSTTLDSTNIEVTNIKAKDGTAAGSIADSTGVVTLASSVLTDTDINGGTIDNVTLGAATAGAGTFTSLNATTADINGGTVDGADITVGSGKTLNVSAGTLTLADNQISGNKIDGGTISSFASTGIDDNASSTAITIDSSQRVGIGATSATNDALLTIRDSGTTNPMARISFDSGDSGVTNGVKLGYTAATFAPDFEISNGDAGIIRFSTNNTERIRIMSGGNVGLGTTAPDVPLHVKGGSSVESAIIVDSTGVGGGHKYGIRPGSPGTSNGHFTIHDEVNNATRLAITDGGLVLINTTAAIANHQLRVHGGSSTGAIAITAATGMNSTISFGDPANSLIGRIEYAHNGDQMRFFTNGSQRMVLDQFGRLFIRKTTAGLTLSGVENNFSADNGYFAVTSTGASFHLNRQSSDGALATFRHNNVTEGSISVSGTTVSFNGGHLSRWSQASDGNRIDGLLKGTVMTNLDKMAVWTSEDGSTTKDNEQLNCMAVSSEEGDKNVAGVFVNWNEDKNEDLNDIYASSAQNDMNIAMTGDMVIRIASGTTIARGDLLMSAGDGTAKPQGDDIVRSKTIAKVTSTNVSYTYSDGSYLVPCVLMAC